MTLEQVKTLVVGVLEGWFPNKKTLDKLTEVDGKLYYNGTEVSLNSLTEADVQKAIQNALAELNKSDDHDDIDDDIRQPETDSDEIENSDNENENGNGEDETDVESTEETTTDGNETNVESTEEETEEEITEETTTTDGDEI